MSDELRLRDLVKVFHHLRLSFKIVFMLTDLVPESGGLIRKVNVFLRNDRVHSSFDRLEVFVLDVLNILSLLNQEFINAANQILSRVLW